MNDKPISATVGDTYNGDSFTQTVEQDGTETYAINGAQVDKADWKERIEAAQTNEMAATAGTEPEQTHSRSSKPNEQTATSL